MLNFFARSATTNEPVAEAMNAHTCDLICFIGMISRCCDIHLMSLEHMTSEERRLRLTLNKRRNVFVELLAVQSFVLGQDGHGIASFLVNPIGCSRACCCNYELGRLESRYRLDGSHGEHIYLQSIQEVEYGTAVGAGQNARI